jgi:hypothetical protein
MQNNTDFSPQESIRLIESMIKEARNKYSENGHLYLFWGWVILLCSAGNFILSYFKLYDKPYMIWWLTLAAGIYQAVYIAKHKMDRSAKSYTDILYGYIWLSFGILLLLAIIMTAIKGNWDFLYPQLLALYGMPVFLSGIILRFTPLKTGAFICWLLAIAASSMSMQYHLLLLVLAIIIAWLIPGYMLQAKYKKENQ